MTYQLFDSNDKLIQEAYSEETLWELYENELMNEGYWINQSVPCKKCDNAGEERSDAYGISTGYWCDSCYNSSKYPYRKDKYPTIENHGYGERLDDNY